MTNKEMFEKSFQRPKNYFSLCEGEQWNIDASLGILDWDGAGLTADERHRYDAHYGFGPKKKDSKLEKVDNTPEKEIERLRKALIRIIWLQRDEMYDATNEARYRFSRAIAIVAVADESYRAAVEKELGVDCKGDSNYYDYR